MAMERGLLRFIMRIRAQAHASGALLQRGAALPMREYAASAFTSAPDGFSRMELRESMVGAKTRPVWQEWSRGYANSSVEKDDVPQGNEEFPELSAHKTTVTTKRYAIGRTAITDDEVQGEQVVKEIKEKAKEILQQVGEKLGETVEEAKIRQLQEKLAATEGIGDVVHELYNQQEEHTDYSQAGAAGVKA